MSRNSGMSMPLPAGMAKARRSFFQSSGFRWITALPVVLLSTLFVYYLWRGHVNSLIGQGMPCGAAMNDLPVIDIGPDVSDEVLAEHNGKAVIVRGALRPEEIHDEDFNLKYDGIFLRRSIEMYQWAKEGSEYHKHWYPYVIDSSSFSRGHLNPLVMPFHDVEHLAESISFEHQLTVSPDMVDQFNFMHRVHVEVEDLEKLPPKLQGTFRVANEQFFRGRDIRYPSVGDVRVHFSGIAAVNVTIIAQLEGKKLVACRSGAIVSPSHGGGQGGQQRVENAFVHPGILNMGDMRKAFAATVDHGVGLPWWLAILGAVHVLLIAGVGFMALFTGAGGRGRESRID